MKNIFNKILLVTLLLVSTIEVSKAATYTAYTAAQTTNGASVASNGVAIYRIYLQNTNNTAGANHVVLYDAGGSLTNGSTNIFYDAPSPAYLTASLQATNRVIIYTNIAGVTETYTNAEYFWATSSVAAAKTLKAATFTVDVPAGTNAFDYRPTYPIFSPAGIVITNTYGLTVTIEYAPLK